MKTRFNIALIPITKSAEFIQCAKNFYGIATTYKLGVDSLPHVTICQFMAEENDVAAIWETICDSSALQSILLNFNAYSFFSSEAKSWISLLPDHLDALVETHFIAANLIETRIGRCFKSYDPHMTLVSTQEKNFKAIAMAHKIRPIQDLFVLSLGKADELGQYQKVLYTCEPMNK
jgi:hypothetical protein